MFKVTNKQLQVVSEKICFLKLSFFEIYSLCMAVVLFFQQAMQLMQTNPDEARRRWRPTAEWKMFTLPPQNGSMKNRILPIDSVTFQISRHFLLVE